jgi:hypothetical protein
MKTTMNMMANGKLAKSTEKEFTRRQKLERFKKYSMKKTRL